MTFLIAAFAVMATILIVSVAALRFLNHQINMARLQIWVAISCGYLITNLFSELLPRSLENSGLPSEHFFLWVIAGIFSVLIFERYLEPRLAIFEKFLNLKSAPVPKGVGIVPGEDVSHHHHDHFSESENCDHSHEHSHLHQHTHQDWFGAGAVCSVLACFMTCAFFDGVALASVQSLGLKMSALLLIGVIFHTVPEGILSGVLVLAGGGGIRGAQVATALIATSFFAGAVVPHVVAGWEGQFLGLASGILLFVVLVQLLPTALKIRFAPFWIAAGSAAFFAAHFILDEMIGH